MNLLEDEHDAALEEMIEACPVEEMAKLTAAQARVKRFRWYRDSVKFLIESILEPENAELAPPEPVPGEPLDPTEYE